MKNHKKIFIINFILILVVLVSFEFICHYIYLKKYPIGKEFKISQLFQYYKPKVIDVNLFVYDFKSTKKRPIITMGCSFTEGVEGSNKTFAYELSRVTGRKTYNRGKSASGPTFILWQLEQKDFKKQIPDAEYVFYIFVTDHIYRIFRRITIYSNGTIYQPLYIERDGKVKEIKPYLKWLYPLYSVKLLHHELYMPFLKANNFQTYSIPVYMSMIKAMNDKIHGLYPNSKFVFIEYPVGNYKRLNAKQIQQIKDMGIIYFNVEDLIGKDFNQSKYQADEHWHPNYLAYQKMTEALVKKLNL